MELNISECFHGVFISVYVHVGPFVDWIMFVYLVMNCFGSSNQDRP